MGVGFLIRLLSLVLGITVLGGAVWFAGLDRAVLPKDASANCNPSSSSYAAAARIMSKVRETAASVRTHRASRTYTDVAGEHTWTWTSTAQVDTSARAMLSRGGWSDGAAFETFYAGDRVFQRGENGGWGEQEREPGLSGPWKCPPTSLVIDEPGSGVIRVRAVYASRNPLLGDITAEAVIDASTYRMQRQVSTWTQKEKESGWVHSITQECVYWDFNVDLVWPDDLPVLVPD